RGDDPVAPSGCCQTPRWSVAASRKPARLVRRCPGRDSGVRRRPPARGGRRRWSRSNRQGNDDRRRLPRAELPGRQVRQHRDASRCSVGGNPMTTTSHKAGTAVDPVTFEIVRHRLYAVNEEAATAIARISGSPVANEAFDFNTALLNGAGEV